ncbi:MAG: hypothetical protein HRF46_07810, partial [Acidobacteriota bacterium]
AAAALIRLATDRPLAARLAAAAPRAVQEGWSLEGQLAELDGVYRQLAGECSAAVGVRRAGR